jgi:hypothetical protein
MRRTGASPAPLLRGRAHTRADVDHLEQVLSWFGWQLWDLQPSNVDAYFGWVLRRGRPTRDGAQAIKTYFEFLELRLCRDPGCRRGVTFVAPKGPARP